MRKWLEKLANMVERNYEYDPWIEAISVEEALEEVEEEISEIRKALENGDDENLKEEIGDLLWTTSLVFLVAVKMGHDPNEIVSMLEEKMKRRKPYIFKSWKPSLKEAVRMWMEAKEREHR